MLLDVLVKSVSCLESINLIIFNPSVMPNEGRKLVPRISINESINVSLIPDDIDSINVFPSDLIGVP